MNFIHSFFNMMCPFKLYDFVNMSSNSITSYFNLFSIMLFMCSGLYYFIKLEYIGKSCLKIIQLTKSSNLESIQSIYCLKELWKEYKQTLVFEIEDKNYSGQDAASFFSAGRIIDRCLNLRYWTMLPGTFVGIGILGTFVGLTYGVGNFDTGSTEAIRSSISQLLAGMNTAFSTSVWGMLLSLLFSFIEKLCFRRFEKKSQMLVKNFDNIFKISLLQEKNILQKEHSEMIRLNIQSSLNDLFVLNENGEETRPAYILRDILEEAKKQSHSMSNFSTDLSEAIGEVVSRPINGALERLSQAIEELRSEKNQGVQEMSEMIVCRLEESIKSLLSNMHQEVSGSTQVQLQKLAELMANSGSAMERVPKDLLSAIETFREQIGEMGKTMREASEHSLDLAQKTSLNISGTIDDTSSRLVSAVALLDEAVSRSSASLDERTAQTVIGYEEMTNSMKEMANKFENILETAASIQSRFNDTAVNLNQSMSLTVDMVKKIEFSMESLKDIQKESIGAISDLRSENSLMAAKRKEMAEQVTSNLVRLENLHKEYVDKFQIIESGLKSIFQEIQKGLTDYQNGVQKNLNDTLSSFSDKLSSAVTGLANAVEEIEEVVDKIKASFSKA